jgi:hypothetical protein
MAWSDLSDSAHALIIVAVLISGLICCYFLYRCLFRPFRNFETRYGLTPTADSESVSGSPAPSDGSPTTNTEKVSPQATEETETRAQTDGAAEDCDVTWPRVAEASQRRDRENVASWQQRKSRLFFWRKGSKDGERECDLEKQEQAPPVPPKDAQVLVSRQIFELAETNSIKWGTGALERPASVSMRYG